MTSPIRSVKVALAVLLFTTLIPPALAAPPHTVIRGYTVLEQSSYVEVAPGLWMGDTWWTHIPASFQVLSAHSGREVTRVTSDSLFGSFEVSLPPGKYIIVPDKFPGAIPFDSSLEVTVTVKHFTNVWIVYLPTLPVPP
jgi:hypothetical protein